MTKDHVVAAIIKKIDSYLTDVEYLLNNLNVEDKNNQKLIDKIRYYNGKIGESRVALELLERPLLEQIDDYLTQLNSALKNPAPRMEWFEFSEDFLTKLEDFRTIWHDIEPTNIKRKLSDELTQIKIELNRLNQINHSEQIDQTIKELSTTKNTFLEDIENIRKRYDPAMAKLETLTNVIQFSDAAITWKRKSRLWVGGIIISSLLFIILLWTIYQCFKIDTAELIKLKEIAPNNVSSILNFEIAKNIGFRVLLLSFGSFLIAFFVKNYNNCQHNATINEHKASSLTAALQLLGSAKTEEGNDNLMIQASSAIFSHQSTGYNKNSPENIPIGILDHVKDIISKGDK